MQFFPGRTEKAVKMRAVAYERDCFFMISIREVIRMVLEFTKFVDAVSCATDFVEAEFLHVPRYHEKRVAVMVNRMGRYLELDQETLYAITIAAAMHDCALAEYLQDEVSEHNTKKDERNMGAHCRAGEDVMKRYPFYGEMEGAVLYHHETADGKGVHGLAAVDTPLSARLIHLICPRCEQPRTIFERV